MESKLIRSFYAIPVSPDCRQKFNTIEQELKKVLPSGIRWVSTDNLYVTLKFLGEFDSKLIPKIYKLLETGLSTKNQFEMIFQNLGVFPNTQKPKVVWIGLGNPIELINIFNEIESAANELGYPKEERGFSPHVTIGRVKNHASDLSKIAAIINNLNIGEICRSQADRVVFYRSSLTPTGPVYSELFQIHLKR